MKSNDINSENDQRTQSADLQISDSNASHINIFDKINIRLNELVYIKAPFLIRSLKLSQLEIPLFVWSVYKFQQLNDLSELHNMAHFICHVFVLNSNFYGNFSYPINITSGTINSIKDLSEDISSMGDIKDLKACFNPARDELLGDINNLIINFDQEQKNLQSQKNMQPNRINHANHFQKFINSLNNFFCFFSQNDNDATTTSSSSMPQPTSVVSKSSFYLDGGYTPRILSNLEAEMKKVNELLDYIQRTFFQKDDIQERYVQKRG